MRIKQTGESEWIVACQYDGLRLAGPFKTKGEAFEAMDGLTPAVVRSIAGAGFRIVNEDTGVTLAGPIANRRSAEAERLRLCQPIDPPDEAAKPRRGRPPKEDAA